MSEGALTRMQADRDGWQALALGEVRENAELLAALELTRWIQRAALPEILEALEAAVSRADAAIAKAEGNNTKESK